MERPLIAVTMGDPAGVGPEIVAKALSSERASEAAACAVIGDKKIMERAIRITGAPLSIHAVESPERGDYRRGVLNLIDVACGMDGAPFGKASGACGRSLIPS